jgi:hypothetical protein
LAKHRGATLAISSEIGPTSVSRLDLQSPGTEPGFAFLNNTGSAIDCGTLCHFTLVELMRAKSGATAAGVFWPICELERLNSRSNRPLRAGLCAQRR